MSLKKIVLLLYRREELTLIKSEKLNECKTVPRFFLLSLLLFLLSGAHAFFLFPVGNLNLILLLEESGKKNVILKNLALYLTTHPKTWVFFSRNKYYDDDNFVLNLK